MLSEPFISPDVSNERFEPTSNNPGLTPLEQAQELLRALEDPTSDTHAVQIAGLELGQLASTATDYNSKEVVVLLIKTMQDNQAEILPRACAARALGRARAKEGFEPLIDTLSRAIDLHIRGSAVEGLGSLGDYRAVEPLSQILFDPQEDEVIRCIAAWSLADIGRSNTSTVERRHTLIALFNSILESQEISQTLKANVEVALTWVS